ncbi:MAG: GNAT family N-acetyltransferase [Solobacterium sp.]|nr:GNAT family N-acetyltransferase [Solobacterium sp.]
MINYRRAELTDMDLLIRYRIQQLNDEEEHPDIDIRDALYTWFERMLCDDRLYQILAEEDGRVIACGALLEVDLPPSFFKPTGKTGYITNMYTLPAYRRNGYAAKILQMLKEEAARRNIDRLLLETSSWGETVYRGNGFTPMDWWMQYILKGGEY